MSQQDDDDVDEAPHPREATALFGHRAAEAALLAAYRAGRMPHGILIAAFSSASEQYRWFRSRAMIHRSAISTPFSALALSRGLYALAGMTATP